MKTVFALIAMIFLFSGCSIADKPYGKAKKVYKAGETIIDVLPVEPTSKLKAIDKAAKKYDRVRTIIREE